MSFWSRITNAVRSDKLSREIDEEFASHLDEAKSHGRDPEEALRAFGSTLRQRERSRDARLAAWLDGVRADAIFGWRQLMKRKVTSAAAILSLGVAIGACTSAFRLIDALLLRPLPVSEPERLYGLSRLAAGFDVNGHLYDTWAYPDFRLMRSAVKGQAELIAASYCERFDLTYKSDAEMENAHLQYVSGWMFGAFGLKPVLGRLFTENDDLIPGAHPHAVLSHEYWARRFGEDTKVIGRIFHMGDTVYEIAGVIEGPFTGTETGLATDIFIPTMMNPYVTRDDATWFRTLVRVNPGVAVEPLRQKLDAASRAFEAERAKGFTGMSSESRKKFLNQILFMEPAAAGVSGLQQDYRRSLLALAVLVALVLLIACANVANLLSAQAAARAREMALRVAIGAGRGRLVQLVLVESAWLGIFAAGAGALFAAWSAPFVVSRINPADNPARLVLPADWRVLAFGLALTFAVTLLFGIAPALRASSIRPASAIRGGSDPHSRRRLMNGLIVAQVAFCFLVIFVAGLFSASFDRLSHRPVGFSTERLLALETVAQRPQPAAYWDSTAAHLRALPGVEKVSLAGWALPGGNSWNSFVSINGAPPGPVLAYFLPIAPGWVDTMKIRFVQGRDFRESDSSPGSAIINEAFARQFFPGQSAIGRFFARGSERSQVVGVIGDAPYRNIREPVPPVAYVPLHSRNKEGGLEPSRVQTFLVRSINSNPLVLTGLLRHEVSSFQPAFRVSNVHTQLGLVQAQTVRERLLAMLGLFFAAVALLLASIGLYGVLDYSVLQRRREIGIRLAIGARPFGIAQLVTSRVFFMVFGGTALGLALGISATRYLESLVYEVKATEWNVLVVPAAAILVSTLLASLPAVFRAVHIDPIKMLRSE